MEYRAIFKKAYAKMNEPIIEGDCGLLCNHHCCRSCDENGEEMGMYLLPHEYESMIQLSPFQNDIKVECHLRKDYHMPKKIKQLYYIYCGHTSGCLRAYRPVQCRTYPFEPHLEKGELFLVVERGQIHACPLLKDRERWRKAFVKGIFEGWEILMEIPEVRLMVNFDSIMRKDDKNIEFMLRKSDVL